MLASRSRLSKLLPFPPDIEQEYAPVKSRHLALALIVVAAAAAGGCGKKKPVPTIAPPPADGPPKIVPKAELPPPKLTASQKVAIEGDFAEARRIVAEARDARMKGEQLMREKGPEAANDIFVVARKKYRIAAGKTEKWVEPDLHEVTQRQLDLDPEVKSYFEERGSWIKEDASMGQKLNAR